MNSAHHTCQTCAFLMLSDASDTQFKCGFEPHGRSVQVRHVALYRPVQPSDSCRQWQESGSSALSEKFI
ncbi:hypothetical protein [Limnohabitans sp. G3-2]|uniref:hypothetical protein n=1 Tax=Limnohabitans sp. G3-2 TaxID=1100711 RepID=UPI0013045DC9|nr:hypothetical protein [Limnohabitans sp. G3-2]